VDNKHNQKLLNEKALNSALAFYPARDWFWN
jgi:hypothetical protein